MSNPNKVITVEEFEALEREAIDVSTLVHTARARLDNLPRDQEDWIAIARTLEAAARKARAHAKAKA